MAKGIAKQGTGGVLCMDGWQLYGEYASLWGLDGSSGASFYYGYKFNPNGDVPPVVGYNSAQSTVLNFLSNVISVTGGAANGNKTITNTSSYNIRVVYSTSGGGTLAYKELSPGESFTAYMVDVRPCTFIYLPIGCPLLYN